MAERPDGDRDGQSKCLRHSGQAAGKQASPSGLVRACCHPPPQQQGMFTSLSLSRMGKNQLTMRKGHSGSWLQRLESTFGWLHCCRPMARSTALQEQMVELSGQGGKGEGKGRKRECTCMLGIKDPTVLFKAHPLH